MSEPNQHLKTAWLRRALLSSLGALPLFAVWGCAGTTEGRPSGGNGGGSGSASWLTPCDDPTDYGFGFERCGQGGPLHRTQQMDCSTRYSGPNGCLNDSECDAASLCLCGEFGGSCVSAGCKTDADCAAGLRCQAFDLAGCGHQRFTCQTVSDSCQSNADCTGTGTVSSGFGGFGTTVEVGTFCDADETGFSCHVGGCSIGRPFLVEGNERLAPLRERSDWLDCSPPLEFGKLSSEVRQRAAQEWANVGRMEHASIAAFARFALQLLQLGAPPTLVEQSTRAMMDETRHAKLAFAIAGRLAGRAIGPGPLDIEHSLEPATLLEVVALVFREGCVGETGAALEAREAAEHAEPPALREALLGIAEDEARHAELAWHFVRWAVQQQPASVAAVVGAELRLAAAAFGPAEEAEGATAPDELRLVGIVPTAVRARLRGAALSEVIVPCAQALLAQSPGSSISLS